MGLQGVKAQSRVRCAWNILNLTYCHRKHFPTPCDMLLVHVDICELLAKHGMVCMATCLNQPRSRTYSAPAQSVKRRLPAHPGVQALQMFQYRPWGGIWWDRSITYPNPSSHNLCSAVHHFCCDRLAAPWHAVLSRTVFSMLWFCCVCVHGHLGNSNLNIGMANEAWIRRCTEYGLKCALRVVMVRWQGGIPHARKLSKNS